jgi:hypothetical protein
VESRHLGVIDLEGGPGGGWLNTSVAVAGTPVPFRLEIDYPGRFDEMTLSKIDMALDSLDSLDTAARELISAAVQQSDSAPAQLFEDWTGAGDSGDFLRELQPASITMQPDGGRGSLDRLVYVYVLPGSPPQGKITVRFREGIGPELDPAPRR